MAWASTGLMYGGSRSCNPCGLVLGLLPNGSHARVADGLGAPKMFPTALGRRFLAVSSSSSSSSSVRWNRRKRRAPASSASSLLTRGVLISRDGGAEAGEAEDARAGDVEVSVDDDAGVTPVGMDEVCEGCGKCLANALRRRMRSVLTVEHITISD